MPTIYLTAFNSGEAVPIFQKKGIAYLMPGRVSAPSVFVQTANYFFYPVAFLQMAIICCFTKLVTELDSGFHALFKSIRVTTFFNRPVCTFRFKSLTPEEIINLKAMGLQQDLTNSNLFVGSPGPEHLATIWKMGPVEDRLRPGHVGSDGYFAWTYLVKGVQAFITARNNTDGRANLRYSLKQSVKFDKEGDILRVGRDIFKGKHGFTSGRSIITTNDIFLHPPVEDLSSLPGSFTQLHEAKAMPETSVGFYFAYFQGLNTADKEIAADVFTRLFPNLVSSSSHGCSTMLRQIQSGARTLAFSEAGLALAHIYRVFAISLEVPDVSLSVLMKGNSYQGMIMVCHPDTVLEIYGKKYTAGIINEEIRKVDLLESQAEKIVSLLGGAMDLDGVVKREYTTADFLTSRHALRSWNSVNKQAYAASDILRNVKDILKKMEFTDTFAPPSASNVQLAINAIISKDFSGLADFPAYLGGTVLNDSDVVTEAFSMFGPHVPSFNTGIQKQCLTFQIPAADKPDNNLVKTDGKRPLQYLPFYSIAQGTAVTQWNAVFNTSTIRFPMGRKDKKEFASLHRAVFTVGAEKELETMYNGIKQICGERRAGAAAGSKRKRGADEEGAPKRARMMESTLMDDL